MTRCPECSRPGADVDHVPAVDLPPALARFEHFLAHRGVLSAAPGLPDPELPWRSPKMPARPMSPKGRRGLVAGLAGALVELGYLTKRPRGRYAGVRDKHIPDLGVPEVAQYLSARFPPDPCRRHGPGCTRCCRPHHAGTYNRVAAGLRKLAEWLAFEEGAHGRPAWTRAKLRSVYAITPRSAIQDSPPEINPPERAIAFRAWLEEEARRREAAGASRVHAEMPRAYAYELWWLQQLSCRYEEMAHAEHPLDGPENYWARLHQDRGTVEICGKGVGGKRGEVTLTREEIAKIAEILRWRADLGAFLRAHTGREPDPALFLVLHKRRDRTGRRLDEFSTGWNRTLQEWARRYNAWLAAQGRSAEALDVRLVSSHRIGRATAITRDAMDGIADTVTMARARIAKGGYATLARYKRPDVDAIRRHLEEHRSARPATPAPLDGPSDVAAELRALRETVERLQEDLRQERERNRLLQDRLLGIPVRVEVTR